MLDTLTVPADFQYHLDGVNTKSLTGRQTDQKRFWMGGTLQICPPNSPQNLNFTAC